MKINLNKKKIFFQITILVCLIVIGILIRNITSSTASIETTSLLKNQMVDSLLFTNATLENNKLKVAVHNTQEEPYSLRTITVSFLDIDNNVITSIDGYIGNTVTSKFPKQLVVETNKDLSHATSIQYIINK